MKVTQITEILNDVLPETLGESAVKLENLENLVDIGKMTNEALLDGNVDNFMKKLVNRIGKTIFVDRPYSGSAPSIMMDGWEYGSILQKIRSDLPTTQENPTWKLVNGQDYPVTKLTVPTVSQKFFNQKDTYEIPMSFARKQLMESFTSGQGINALFSLIQGWIEKRKTIDRDELTMRTINTFIAATMYEAYSGTGYGDSSKGRAINLLYLYNTQTGKNLKAKDAMFDLEFIKFAAYQIAVTSDRMERASRLFNIGKTTKFTPKNMQKIVMLSDFAKAADVYLQSDTFHNEYTKLPEAERVVFWQGSGTDYSWDSISKIHLQIQNPTSPSENVTVEQTGILAAIFDRDALGICNVRDYVTSFYNPHAEFENMWFKYDAQYFNDYDENGVVFFVADAAV